MSIIEKAIKGAGKTAPNSRRPSAASVERATPEERLRAGEEYLAPEPDESSVLRSDVPVPPGEAPAVPTGGGLFPDAGPHTEAARTSHSIELSFDKLQKMGFLTPNTPRSRIAEEFRGIKRPILRNIAGKDDRSVVHPNLVMVTSALQGDGKTFSSINLAISIAMEQDKTVLFVDADVVRATAGRIFGIDKSTPGLIDLLAEDSRIDPADVILRTNIDTLRVLPAGNASDKSTELLASETMHQFMIELANRYPDRVIVFDSPPLLLTTEASVLASFMGQIVFVASADVTPQNAVQEALEHIGEDKIAGVLLNRASRRRSKLLGVGSYGYGYGYGYGNGYARDEERRDSGSVDAVNVGR